MGAIGRPQRRGHRAAGERDLLFAHVVQLSDNSGAGGDTSLRVVNASPDSGLLDVKVAGPTNQTVAANLAYGGVSGYTELVPGHYTLNVYQAGASNAIQSVSPVPVDSGNAYTVVLGGLLPGSAAPNVVPAPRTFVPIELTDQNAGRSASLTAGCNQVVLSVPAGTSVTSIVQRVASATAVASVWRFDNAAHLLRAGYFSDPTAPVDYTVTAASPEAAFVCLTSPTSWNPT